MRKGRVDANCKRGRFYFFARRKNRNVPVSRVLFVGLGLSLAWSSVGFSQTSQLQEIQVSASRNASLVVPPEYGRLVSVVADSEVHHLYFEDSQGTIRVVLVGRSGAVQRARQNFQLLTRDVYVIGRQADEQPVPVGTP